MTILIGFIPFALFVVADRFAATPIALAIAAVAALVLGIRDVAAHRSLKLLELGAFALFGGLAIYTAVGHTDWSVLDVRLRVDGGLLAIVALSLAIRRPFTLQYARESVPQSLWHEPRFLRVNNALTATWTAAFAAIVAADVAMIHGLPVWAGVAVTLAAIALAARFTTKTTNAH
jgi:hypothetical protein